MAELLAKDSQYPGDISDLALIAQFYEYVQVDREDLEKQLRVLFERVTSPNPLHEYLAKVASQSNLLIVTTNYDRLIELAFDRQEVSYSLIIHSTTRDQVLWKKHDDDKLRRGPPKKVKDIDPASENVIYKMHGSVQPIRRDDNFVITEDDYVDYLSRLVGNTAIPPDILLALQERRLLFLGYSLRDWNLRVILSRIASRSQGVGPTDDNVNGDRGTRGPPKRSWSIQDRVSKFEKEIWDSRSVTTYEMTIGEFFSGLVSDRGG